MPKTTRPRQRCIRKNAATVQGPGPTSSTAVSGDLEGSEHGETLNPNEPSSTNEIGSDRSVQPVSEYTSDKMVKGDGRFEDSFLSKFPKRPLPKSNLTTSDAIIAALTCDVQLALIGRRLKGF